MADLPLCLGRRAFALPAGRGQDAEAVLMLVLMILAILLFLSSAFLQQLPLLNEKCCALTCYVWRENSCFGFILFLSSLKTPLLSDWGEEMNMFLHLKHPRWMVFYPCCRGWLNLVYGFEKLFSGTLLACRSELEQQVLTTGFPLTLMPLWFAGFGSCFCLPAFHRSPQHMGPSCDFTRMRRWLCSVLLKLL